MAYLYLSLPKIHKNTPWIHHMFLCSPFDGGASRDRTDGLLRAKQALSQLSYGPLSQRHFQTTQANNKTKQHNTEKNAYIWWAWEDSNFRPHPYQGCALTNWATSPSALFSVLCFTKPKLCEHSLFLLGEFIIMFRVASCDIPPHSRASKYPLSFIPPLL